jgi:hypothetical protein
MRKTRFMSLLFLVWSIAFFFVPDFRQGLQVPIFALGMNGDEHWLERAGTIPADKLREATTRTPDAQTFAFAALHAPTMKEALDWGSRAVAMDTDLTWIDYSIAQRALFAKPVAPEAPGLVSQLEKWDPDNSIPFLLEAQMMEKQKPIAYAPTPAMLENAAKDTEWVLAMQKAFAAPRYDSYFARRFELERTWLRQNHYDKPAIVLVSAAAYPIPNLLQIRTYADLAVEKLGKEQEDAGHLPQAMDDYWTVQRMGQRMQANAGSLIEKLIGAAVVKVAYKRLIPALRKAGQPDAATAMEMAQQQLDLQLSTLRGNDPLEQSTNYNWAALTVLVLAGVVAVFGALTILCILYVNLKRWVRPQVKGVIFNCLTVAENYMPVLFFLACAGLYLSYYPYAQNFHHYMTAGGEIRDFEPLFYDVFPYYGGKPGHNALPVGNPLRPYGWFALAGFVIVAVVFWAWGRPASRERTSA